MKYCSACGCKMKDGQKTCPFCGKKYKSKSKKSKETPPMSEEKRKNLVLEIFSLVIELIAAAIAFFLTDIPYLANAVALGIVIVGLITGIVSRKAPPIVLGILELGCFAYVFIFYLLLSYHFGSPSPFPTDITGVYVVQFLHNIFI